MGINKKSLIFIVIFIIVLVSSVLFFSSSDLVNKITGNSIFSNLFSKPITQPALDKSRIIIKPSLPINNVYSNSSIGNSSILIYYNTTYYDEISRKNVTVFIMINGTNIYISNISNFSDANSTLIKIPSNYTKDSYSKSKLSLTGSSFFDAIIDFLSSIFNINLGGGYSIHGGTILKDPRKSYYGIIFNKRF